MSGGMATHDMSIFLRFKRITDAADRWLKKQNIKDPSEYERAIALREAVLEEDKNAP